MIRSYPLAIGALLIAACTSGERRRSASWAGTMDTLPGGTVLVKNPATGVWDSASTWRLEEDLRIGSSDGTGPEVFGSIAYLAVDAAGRLYVLDRQAKEVRVFGAGGAHVRAIGREGAGPGEFRDPIAIALDHTGQLWVVDPNNSRYAVFDSAGKFVTSHVRPISGYTVPWPGGFDSEGRLYDFIFGVPNVEFRRGALLRYTPSFQPGDTIPVPGGGPAPPTFRLVTSGGSMMTVVPFTAGLVRSFDHPRGYLWFGMSDSYRIYQRELDGDTVRVVEREHERLPVTAADREKALEGLEWFTKQGGKVDESKFPALKPVFQQLLVDDAGNLWVRVTEPHGVSASAFDIFDTEGRYLGRVRSSVEISSHPPPRITRNAIYAAVSGDMGQPQVVQLRIVKPDPVDLEDDE